jgi:cytidyltransferase-like protein
LEKKIKKILVSGCFDLLHAGHIAFLKTAAKYGKLYVGIGSDKNVQMLKGKFPYFNQEERIYMVNAIKYVEHAFLNSGTGMLDFEPDLQRISPDILIVNTDGDTTEKKKLCKKYGIEYIILNRIPEQGLQARSSSDIKKELRFPYRLCLAGGWIDQPWVSKIHHGSVVVAQIYPTLDFNDRSGLATSSRKVGIELWGDYQPEGDPIRNAKILFGAENPPGTKYISGSQDHIGLLVPGINRLYYSGEYWPKRIDSITKKDVCEWLSQVLHLVLLKPRPMGYNPLKTKNLKPDWIKNLGQSGDLCYQAILEKDIKKLGQALNQTFLMWEKIFPYTIPDWVMDKWIFYNKSYHGAITSGSGGGYMIIASEKPVTNAIKIKIKY